MVHISKATDVVGIILSIYLGISYIPIVRKYYDVVSGPIPAEGSSWYLTAYGLLIGSIYGFYRSLVRSNNNMPANQWPLGRILAWPSLLVSFGIYELFVEAYNG